MGNVNLHQINCLILINQLSDWALKSYVLTIRVIQMYTCYKDEEEHDDDADFSERKDF